jgi:hypothetical protein
MSHANDGPVRPAQVANDATCGSVRAVRVELPRPTADQQQYLTLVQRAGQYDPATVICGSKPVR